MTVNYNFVNFLNNLSNTTSNGIDFEAGAQIKWKNMESERVKKCPYPNQYAKYAFSYLAEQKPTLTHSMQTLHPNLINYFLDNNVAEIIKEDKRIYLKSKTNESEKIELSAQINFGYEFTKEIKEYCDKMKKLGKRTWISKIINYDGTFKMKMEYIIKSSDENTSNNSSLNDLKKLMMENKIEDNVRKEIEQRFKDQFDIKKLSVKSRIDFLFVLKESLNPIQLGVEFLEVGAHKPDMNELDNSQIFRKNKIDMYNKNSVTITCVWQNLWDRNDEFRQHFIESLDRLFEIHNCSENKEDFTIDFLSNYIHDKELCRNMVMAYQNEKYKKTSNSINENYPILLNNDFFVKFKIREDKIKEIKKELKEILDNNFKNEKKSLKNNDINDKKAIKSYYGKENIRVNGKGLYYLASLCVIKGNNWFLRYEHGEIFKSIYHQLGYAVVDAGEKMFTMTEELKKKELSVCFGKDHYSKDKSNRGFYKELLKNNLATDESDDESDEESDNDSVEEKSNDETDCDGISDDINNLNLNVDSDDESI